MERTWMIINSPVYQILTIMCSFGHKYFVYHIRQSIDFLGYYTHNGWRRSVYKIHLLDLNTSFNWKHKVKVIWISSMMVNITELDLVYYNFVLQTFMQFSNNKRSVIPLTWSSCKTNNWTSILFYASWMIISIWKYW